MIQNAFVFSRKNLAVFSILPLFFQKYGIYVNDLESKW
jgi:hypothetical protein